MDSYASYQSPTSTIQRTDSKLLEEGLQPISSRGVTESPRPVSHDPPEVFQTASTSSSNLTKSSGNLTTSDGRAVRVRTKSHDLKSGFPYHPGLYDLRVRPDGKRNGIGYSNDTCDITNTSRLAAVQ
jgi:hypothetical protein